MPQKIEFPQLREQAIALRRAGKSRREIKELLAITSNWTLNEVLKGEPPQPWTWRPNAKDPLRDKARDLRKQGLNYNQIAAELGVSKSSVSLWVRDLPRPAGLSPEACQERSAARVRDYWAAERPAREAGRAAVRATAAAEIGQLTEREVIIAGAITYWCEGARASRTGAMTGSASSTAILGWSGSSYHGCLRIDVRRSASLYLKIEGWAAAAMASPDGPAW
jgi:transcriptional regulator with XRE-family HTH domain